MRVWRSHRASPLPKPVSDFLGIKESPRYTPARNGSARALPPKNAASPRCAARCAKARGVARRAWSPPCTRRRSRKLIESLPPAQREVVWNFVEPEIEGDVLVELSEDVRQAFIDGMDAEELLAAAENMELDDLADLVGDLPEAVSLQLVKSMDAAGPRAAEDRAVLRAGYRRRPHEHRHGERARRRHRGSGAALPAHARRAARQDRPAVRGRPQRPAIWARWRSRAC